ncbi:MAG: DMT family transporter [Sulfurospirillaceae bacterium]|nr:DMT family transporter [Sulfurospirillaceae bacterium]
MQKIVANVNKGVLFMVISSLCFAIDGAFAKILSAHMEPVEVVFFRNTLGLFLIGATLFRKPIRQIGGRVFLLLFRAFVGLSAMMAFFYNIAHISFADAMTFSRTAPIFTAVFAFLFLKEKIGLKGWIAVLVGFVGIVCIMKPDGLMFETTDILGLYSGVGAALAYTSVRELGKFYDTRSIVMAFVGLGSIVPLMMMIASKYSSFELEGMVSNGFVMPSGLLWFYIVCMGIFGAIGQVFMTKSFSVEKAGIVGTAGYSIIFFSLIIGVMLGDAMPDILGLFGIFLVVASGIVVAKQKS